MRIVKRWRGLVCLRLSELLDAMSARLFLQAKRDLPAMPAPREEPNLFGADQ